MESANLILADCDPSEIQVIKEAIERHTNRSFEIRVMRSNRYHGSKMLTLRRYLTYFALPLKQILKRQKYDIFVGWQQFHALNYVFFCRLFGLHPKTDVYALNFTYKRKGGFVGKIYEKYMRYAISSPLIRMHVPSESYAREMAETFGVDVDRFLVAHFGTVDQYDLWRNLKCDFSDFAMALGCSNRDFDFLVRVWNRPEIKATGFKLVIVSDTWQAPEDLESTNPDIIHLNNIKGKASYPFFVNCAFSVVPVANKTICSGDTVLLNSMMCHKPVVVSNPSTLAEMYVRDGENGLYLPDDEVLAAAVLLKLITDKAYRLELGDKARQSYEKSFTRQCLADNIGRYIAHHSCRRQRR